MSQNGLTRMAGESWMWNAGMRRKTNYRPMKRRPKANFVGVEGSRWPRRTQSQAKAGERRITKIGWMVRNQLDGKLKPRIEVRVKRSPKRLSVDPACSYAPQNTAANTKKTAMAARRFHSVFVKPQKVGSVRLDVAAACSRWVAAARASRRCCSRRSTAG